MHSTNIATVVLFIQLRALVLCTDPIESAMLTNHLGLTQSEAADLFIHGYPLYKFDHESFHGLDWSADKQREVMRFHLEWTLDQGFAGLYPTSLYNINVEVAA